MQHLFGFVDTTFGTGGDGNCFPGATCPFGMIQVGYNAMQMCEDRAQIVFPLQTGLTSQ